MLFARTEAPTSSSADALVNQRLSTPVGTWSPSSVAVPASNFGIEARSQHGGGLGGAGFAQDVEERQRIERLGALLRSTQLAIGVVEHQVELGGGGRAGRFALLLLFLFGAPVEHDDGNGGGNAQQQDDDDKHEIGRTLKMDQGREAERQKRGDQKHDDGKYVGEQGDPPNDATTFSLDPAQIRVPRV